MYWPDLTPGISHAFRYVSVTWLPIEVTIGKNNNPCSKRDERQVFIGYVACNDIGIKLQKFTYHPIAVGSYPYTNSKIVAKLTNIIPGTPGDNNRDEQCGDYHRYAKRPPNQAPADIFKQPENNMQVFHFAVAEGYSVAFFFAGFSLYYK